MRKAWPGSGSGSRKRLATRLAVYYGSAMEDRTIRLETTVAFQDERIATLEKVVSQQQLEVHQLAERLERLRKQLIEVAPSLLGELWCMALAMSSLPVPVSPSIRTVALVGATSRRSSKTSC